MTLLLGTICLNEMEWLPYLYEQHKDWPTMIKWVFVEAVDPIYAASSPSLVSNDGLSIDGTTEFLQELVKKDDRVIHIKAGYVGNIKSDQNKALMRQLYLDVANKLQPTYVYVLDADDFYTQKGQKDIIDCMNAYPSYLSFCFRHTDIWRPPKIKHVPLFTYQVNGGYWAVSHFRGWRWQPGIRYNKNHNWPEDSKGRYLINTRHTWPIEWTHLGFASALKYRAAKHIYYKGRGEEKDRQRKKYVICRDAYIGWKIGDILPYGAKVVPYRGAIPEVFLNESGTCRV